MKNAVIFGGTGFIGIFYAEHLIKEDGFDNVFLFDYELIEDKGYEYRKRILDRNNNIHQVRGDVRKKIDWEPNLEICLVVNFAAIHREPGHFDNEYYETNILGSENVCDWATRVNCSKIIFSSSIAPYGISEEKKNENTLPVPKTAYGGSKLVSEKIHKSWNAQSQNNSLIIIRPGVVFGPTEGGNVSRLIKAVKKRYFVYTGNKKIRKAGVYVKELCFALSWTINNFNQEKEVLFNMTMSPSPSVEEYTKSITEVLNKKIWIPSIPINLILILSRLIDFFTKPFGINHPFSHVRILKLIRSNYIEPKFLIDNKYDFKYDLKAALIDWAKECPEEW
jgi:nucleoside-diphosphate-sugar epimerase